MEDARPAQHHKSCPSQIHSPATLNMLCKGLIAAALLAIPWSLSAAGYLGASLSLVGWAWFLSRRFGAGPSPSARHWALAWSLSGVVYALLHVAQLAGPEELRRVEAPSRLLALSGIVFVPLLLRLSWRELAWPLAGAGLCFGAIALLHPPASGPDHRVYGYYSYANMMGFAPMINAILLAAVLRTSHRWTSLLIWAGIAGSLTAVVQSGTRGAWPGILILALVLWRALGRPQDGFKPATRWWLRAGIIAAASVCLWAASSPIKTRLASTSTDLQHITSGDLTGSIGMRLTMAQYAIDLVKAHPVRGNGLSAFHRRIETWADEQKLPPGAMERGFQNPHNQFLHWAQALGLPMAAFCVMALLIVPFVIGRRSLGTARTALCALAATVPIFMLSEAILDRHQGAQWFALVYGLAVGMGLGERERVIALERADPVQTP
jgi:O-antigen ligase